MGGQGQIEKTQNMRSSMADLPAALAHVRTPGVVLVARDVRKLVNLIAAVVTRWSDSPTPPQKLKSD